MKDEKKPLLKKEERQKIIENASIIHQIVEEISAEKKRDKWSFLRHPLLILLIGAVISSFLIPIYQNWQVKTAERIKANYEILKEISSYTGRVLTMAESVIYLHQKPITNVNQIINTNKSFNEAYREFNSNYIRIDFEMRVIFKKKDVSQGWSDVRKELKDLNDSLDLLHEFPTNDISEKHAERIDRCLKKIGENRERLNLLYDFMIEALD
ncbi:MAG: hypothetical protein WBC02_00920 [Candidatus Aminicenantaceae bacterium]